MLITAEFSIQHVIMTILRQAHTHTHTVYQPVSGTTHVSRYQKGKTNLDIIEGRDSEWQWHQLGYILER